MKYLKQLLIILAFSAAAEILAALIPVVPGAIIGFVLLFVALCAGLVKVESIKETAGFLVSVLPVLFVAPTVKILNYWGVISDALVPILVIVVVSTVVVFGVAGIVTQMLRKRGKEDD